MHRSCFPLLPTITDRRPARRAEIVPVTVTPEIVEPERVLIAERTRVRVVEIVVERFYLPRRRCA